MPVPHGQPDRHDQLERRLRASHERVQRLQGEIAALRQSIRYRLGGLFAEACRGPVDALRAPYKLVRLGRAALRRRAERRRTAPAGPTPARGRQPGAPLGGARAVDLPAIRATAPPASDRPLVAAILAPSTAFALRYEADIVSLTSGEWRQQMERTRPAFLLIEAAGAETGGGWNRPAVPDRREMLSLLRYCRAAEVRTVFWHTGEPVDASNLREAAREFDVVFTADVDLLPRLGEACGPDRVHFLPCAAEPRLHNPWREARWPRYPVCLAGARPSGALPPGADEVRNLLDPALPFDPHVLEAGSGRMPAAYRCHDVLLSAAAASPAVVSRQVFESLACGTPVVAADSPALRDLLGDCVRLTRSAAGTTAHLEALLNDEETRAREAHLGYRHVHRHHTWRHRLDAIMTRIGLQPPERPRPSVSVVTPVMRPHHVARAVENFAKQSHPDKELVLVLNNSSFDRDRIGETVRSVQDVQLLYMPGSPTLGECMNRGVRQASGQYVAKMDDDDHYGASYLSDLVLAARFSGAEITGKGTYYAYVESCGVMVLRVVEPEHAYVPGVPGSTLFVERDVLLRVPFRNVEAGEDYLFARDARAAGCRAYSADRFNHVVVRRRDKACHTWKMTDELFLERCRYPHDGLRLPRAMI